MFLPVQYLIGDPDVPHSRLEPQCCALKGLCIVRIIRFCSGTVKALRTHGWIFSSCTSEIFECSE